MKVMRAYKQKLLLTPEQEKQAENFAGQARLVYNLALHQRNFARTLPRTYISYQDQANELPDLKKEFSFLKESPAQCLQQSLKDLKLAFDGFYRKTKGYPKFRSKHHNQSFRFPSPKKFNVKRVNKRKGQVTLPKLGTLYFRWHRSIPSKIKQATIKKEKGIWYIILTCQLDPAPPKNLKPPVGIDRGINISLAFSDGSCQNLPTKNLKIIEAKIASKQRMKSTKEKGSIRYKKLTKQISRLHQKLVNIRHDWHHFQSKKVAESQGYIFLEDLDVTKMTKSAKGNLDAPGIDVAKKSGLNKAILRQGWSYYHQFLSYKSQACGGAIGLVPPAYTSQRCCRCKYVNSNNRSEEDRTKFKCLRCHLALDADYNAAINILEAGLALFAHPLKEHYGKVPEVMRTILTEINTL